MSLASESKILLQRFIQKQSYTNFLTPSVPFRLFKSNILPKELSKTKICLPLNRLVDPLALNLSSSHISIWSQSHLEFLKLINRTRQIHMNKILIKNPYKTEKLIKDCINLGLRTMAVDSFEELWKIHECRCIQKTSSFQIIPLNFVWIVSDLQNDLKQIQTLKSYNIKIGGLFFDQTQTKKKIQIKKFIEKINASISQKNKVRTIYLESESYSFDKTLETYQNDEYFLKNKIETILEKTDFKMTDKYWIAARVIGQSRKKEPILNQEAYNYIGSQQIKRGEIIQKEGKKWLISSIGWFPQIKSMEEHQKKGYIMTIN